MSRRYPDHTKTEHAFRDKTDKEILTAKPWKEYKLHLVVLAIAVISSMIGILSFSITNSVRIVIMPLLYALIMGLILYLFKPFTWIGRKQSAIAEGTMLLFIGPLIAKLAVSSGQALYVLYQVGPALLLHELGTLGTILLALPIALILGFGKEAIGMTHSIGREPNVAIIIDKFGFSSPEARGVLTVFIIGSVIGTMFISILVCILVAVLPFHPYAFAIASGIGSASMNAAALAPLLEIFPQYANDIVAFAGFSNLIAFCFGIYLCIFVAIPFTQKLYKVLKPILRKEKNEPSKAKYNYLDDGYKHKINRPSKENEYDVVDGTDSVSFDGLFNWIALLTIFGIILSIANTIAYHNPIFDTVIGVAILSIIGLSGLLLERYIPLNISSLIYISVIGMLIAAPFSPIAGIINGYVANVELVSIVTVFLAYVGIGIGKNWDKFKSMGWRAIVVTLFVITGCYLGSLIISQLVLMMTSVI